MLHYLLAVAVFEDDPALEEMLKQHLLGAKPVGFLVWRVNVSVIHPTGWGEWIYP